MWKKGCEAMKVWVKSPLATRLGSICAGLSSESRARAHSSVAQVSKLARNNRADKVRNTCTLSTRTPHYLRRPPYDVLDVIPFDHGSQGKSDRVFFSRVVHSLNSGIRV